ncbi:type IV pilin [Halorussus marinus]|uniref:type IV pilin n=1 Tax=Halorussus marinus TaxID=2505976 RepID=UPI0010927C21|nr:type IV pilin [Halorussus marinus]
MRRLAAALPDERATSPAIGATLLVGVTVLLATAAGTGMFSLADSATQGAFASASVSHEPAEDRVSATWMANANADRLRVTVRVGDDRRTVSLQAVGDSVVVDHGGVTVNSGAVRAWDDPNLDDGDRVAVTVVAVKGGETLVVAERSATI